MSSSPRSKHGSSSPSLAASTPAAAAASDSATAIVDLLKQRTASCLARPIPWDGYRRASLLTDSELALIKKVDALLKHAATGGSSLRGAFAKVSSDQLDSYVELFLALLGKINKEETLQFLLCLVGELVCPQPSPVVDDPTDSKAMADAADEVRAAAAFRIDMINRFLRTSEVNKSWPFEPLMRLLERSSHEWFSNAKAASVLSELLLETPHPNEATVRFMSDWFCEQLRKSDERDAAVAVHVLMRYARGPAFRESLSKDGLPLLAGHMKSRMKNVQLVYEIANVVWLLSFNQAARAHMAKTAKIIPVLVEVMKEVQKEKVIRMVIATLANLCSSDEASTTDAVAQMVDYGLARPLQHLSEKNWGDEDLEEDIETIQSQLESNMVHLSSFEVFKKEVLSGKLEWSLVHKSEKFWRENAPRLEEDKFKLLLMIKELMSSDDPLVREVACFDVGEFARHHPRGKVLVNELGLKVPLMDRMINDPDPEVKTQALMAVQKLMVHNWQFLH